MQRKSPSTSVVSPQVAKSIVQFLAGLGIVLDSVTRPGRQAGDISSATVASNIFPPFKELSSLGRTLYARLAPGKRPDLVVDGILPKATSVDKLASLAGEASGPKELKGFMVRTRTGMLAFAPDTEEEELAWLVEVMARTASRGEGVVSTAVMRELVRKGIFSICVVPLDDLPGAARGIPFSVRLLLSKLRLDLERVMNVEAIDPAALDKVANKALLTAAEAVSLPSTAKYVLLNLDLVVGGFKGVTLERTEDLLLKRMSPDGLTEILAFLLEYERGLKASVVARPDKESQPGAEANVRRLASKVAGLLASLDARDAYSVIFKAHENGLIAFEDLPDGVKKRVKARQIAEKFIASAPAYLKQFQECRDSREYLKFSNVLTMVIPELIRRGDTEKLGQIFGLLHSHLHAETQPFPGRKRFVRELVNVLARAGIHEKLLPLALSLPKEQREPLEKGVALFGEKVVQQLLGALATTEESSVCKAACSVLVSIGYPAVKPLVEELRSFKHPWFVVRNIIQVLGEIGAKEAIPAIQPYFKHPQAKVREECVIAVARIMGDEGSKLLLPFLEDQDHGVVKKAVYHLGYARSLHQSFLRTLHTLIRVRSRNEKEPDEALQAAALSVLPEYEYQLLPPVPDLEGDLIQILHAPRMGRWLPGRFGVRPKPKELVLLAIRALGHIGTGKCIDALAAMFESKDPDIRQATAEALELIRQRQTSMVTQKPSKV